MMRGYLSNMVSYMLVTLLLYGVLRMIMLLRKPQPAPLKREVVRGLLIAYLVGLGSQTLVPQFLSISTEVDPEAMIRTIVIKLPDQRELFNFAPFRQIVFFLQLGEEYRAFARLNLIGNLALFVPLGMLLPMYDRKRFSTVRRIVTFGILLSISIECLQFFVGRTVDVDDVMLNTLGTTIGAGMYQLFPPSWQQAITVQEKRLDC